MVTKKCLKDTISVINKYQTIFNNLDINISIRNGFIRVICYVLNVSKKRDVGVIKSQRDFYISGDTIEALDFSVKQFDQALYRFVVLDNNLLPIKTK